ncbi:lanthionine synthetase C family protein [Nonomuraea sp. NPDC049637]|uniref:lanthionine synthetase C family protein n=1 Tax=Nonomuraea sp. NPDC049637 TaxID=3154356 RepID=UPI00341F3058
MPLPTDDLNADDRLKPAVFERRQRARQLISRLAELLAEPERVTTTVEATSQWVELDGGWKAPIWARASLSSGHSGLALLYAELSQKEKALAHLRSAAASVQSLQGYGLHHGAAGLAYALHACADGGEAFSRAKSRLNGAIQDAVLELVERILVGQIKLAGMQSYDIYDPLSGITGVGQYLLACGESDSLVLARIMESLVVLGQPVERDGVRVPGWWIPASPRSPIGPYRNGHLNFGLAHGMAGPLSLFALSRQRGVLVPKHEEGAVAIGEAFVRHVQEDEAGPYWPRYLERDMLLARNGPRSAPTWCYGSVGIARALQMAGIAFARDSWKSLADDVMHAEIRRLPEGAYLSNSFICHGLAGLLLILSKYRNDSPGVVQQASLDAIVDQILERYQEDVPFGFRVPRMGYTRKVDIPGLLEGSAGIALALKVYLDGDATTNWTAVFGV